MFLKIFVKIFTNGRPWSKNYSINFHKSQEEKIKKFSLFFYPKTLAAIRVIIKGGHIPPKKYVK